jgi:predicted NAD/FAD-dependent oxidoreductase
MPAVASRVAVVGGGPCGSVAATMLRAMGLQVKLFDKGERLGGRASTRLAESGGALTALSFDHGAQFLRASHPAIQRLVHSPLAKDLFAPWEGRFGILGPRGGLLPIQVVRTSLGGGGLVRDRTPRAASAEDGPAVYGVEGGEGDDDADALQGLAELDFCSFLERDEQLLVSAPGAQPWQELCERTDVEIAHSTSVVDATRGPSGWVVRSQSTMPQAGSLSETKEEVFDQLVLATHSSSGLASQVLGSLLSDPQHASQEMTPFLPALSELLTKFQNHENDPVFTLLAAYPSPTGVPFDAAVPHGCDKLRWICRDSSKPGTLQRGSLLLITVHGQWPISARHVRYVIAGREREDGVECWVAHCSRAAALQYIAAAPVAAGRPPRQVMENVAGEMGDALHLWLQAAARSNGQVLEEKPIFLRAHRWGSGLATAPLGLSEPALSFEPWNLVVAGDYLGYDDGMLEGALLSGLEAANRVAGWASDSDII